MKARESKGSWKRKRSLKKPHENRMIPAKTIEENLIYGQIMQSKIMITGLEGSDP